MAITIAQRIIAQNMVGIPYTNTIRVSSDNMGLGVNPTNSGPAIVTMNAEITAYLADVTQFTPERETEVVRIVTAYDALGPTDIELVGATIGGMTGINFSTKSQRDFYIQQLHNVFPFLTRWQYLQAMTGKPSTMIPIIS